MPEIVATDEPVFRTPHVTPVSTLETLALEDEVESEAQPKPQNPAAPAYIVVGRDTPGVFSRHATSIFGR